MVRFMEKTRRFRIPVWPVLLLLLAGGIAANLPRDWLRETTPEERRAEVFSAFVNLSAEPGKERGAWVQDWLVWTGQLTKRRRERLEQIHPALLAEYADRLGMGVEALRDRIIDPYTQDPFDLSGNTFDTPSFSEDGSGRQWHWAVSVHDQPDLDSQSGSLAHCGIWLVFWNASDWFYAPVGRADLNEVLLTALPDLGDVSLQALPGCST